jgi:hypothetical protein
VILRLLQTCALPSRVATASSVASPELLLLGDEDMVGAGIEGLSTCPGFPATVRQTGIWVNAAATLALDDEQAVSRKAALAPASRGMKLRVEVAGSVRGAA